MRNETEIREMVARTRKAAGAFAWWDDEKLPLEAITAALDWVLGGNVDLLEGIDPEVYAE